VTRNGQALQTLTQRTPRFFRGAAAQYDDTAVQVIQHNGVVITEYIPHDTTNTVRSLMGKVGQCDVWLRVEAVDPQITEVTVQARTKWGNSDVDLAHEVEKEIALQLSR